MYTVYVLYSRAFDKYYVGYSSDFSSRLRSHNELGTSNWTKRYRPWELIFKKEYSTKIAAMKREKELKSGRGGNLFEKIFLRIYEFCAVPATRNPFQTSEMPPKS
jgi:putative endonuclease